MFGKRKKQIVGCDVGSSAVKLVELKPLKSGEFQLQHAAIAELSSEAIVDGAIMDSSLVVDVAQGYADALRGEGQQCTPKAASGISLRIGIDDADVVPL